MRLDFEQVHGRNEYEFPQLELVRADLDNLPDLDPPPGYSFRSYQEGDAEVWGGIMARAYSPYWNAERFRQLFLPHFGFRPERVIFVCHDGRPVGSASAFQWPGLPKGRGYMHMVGVLEEHCGKALGYWLAVACLHQFKREGFNSALLQTESFRVPAIKHYLRLGFRPELVAEAQRETWRALLERVGREDVISEIDLEKMPLVSAWSFWWRTLLVTQYTGWLNLRAGVFESSR